MSQNIQPSNKLLHENLSLSDSPATEENKLDHLSESDDIKEKSHCDGYGSQQMFCSQINTPSLKLCDIETVSTDYESAVATTEYLNEPCIKELPLTKSSLDQLCGSKVEPYIDTNVSFDTYCPGKISRRPPSTSSSEQSCSEGILHRFFATDEEREQYIAAKRKKKVKKKAYKAQNYAYCKSSFEGTPLPDIAENECSTDNTIKKDNNLSIKKDDILGLLELDEMYRTVKNPSGINNDELRISESSKDNFSTKMFCEISSNVPIEYQSTSKIEHSLLDVMSTNSSVTDSNTAIFIDTTCGNSQIMQENINFISNFSSLNSHFLNSKNDTASQKSLNEKDLTTSFLHSISENPSEAKSNTVTLIGMPSISDIEASARQLVDVSSETFSKITSKTNISTEESIDDISDLKSSLSANTLSSHSKILTDEVIKKSFNREPDYQPSLLPVTSSDVDSNSQSSIGFFLSNTCANSKESVDISPTNSDRDSKNDILCDIISEHSANTDSDSKSPVSFITTSSCVDSNSKLLLNVHTRTAFDVYSNSQPFIGDDSNVINSTNLMSSNIHDKDSNSTVHITTMNFPPINSEISSKNDPSSMCTVDVDLHSNISPGNITIEPSVVNRNHKLSVNVPDSNSEPVITGKIIPNCSAIDTKSLEELPSSTIPDLNSQTIELIGKQSVRNKEYTDIDLESKPVSNLFAATHLNLQSCIQNEILSFSPKKSFSSKLIDHNEAINSSTSDASLTLAKTACINITSNKDSLTNLAAEKLGTSTIHLSKIIHMEESLKDMSDKSYTTTNESNLNYVSDLYCNKFKISDLNLSNKEIGNDTNKTCIEISPSVRQTDTFLKTRIEKGNITFSDKTNQNISFHVDSPNLLNDVNETSLVKIDEIKSSQSFNLNLTINNTCSENTQFSKHLVDDPFESSLHNINLQNHSGDLQNSKVECNQLESTNLRPSKAKKSFNSKQCIKNCEKNFPNADLYDDEVSTPNNVIVIKYSENELSSVYKPMLTLEKDNRNGTEEFPKNFNKSTLSDDSNSVISLTECIKAHDTQYFTANNEYYSENVVLPLEANNVSKDNLLENKLATSQKSRKTFPENVNNGRIKSIARKSFSKANLFTPDDLISCSFDNFTTSKKRKTSSSNLSKYSSDSDHSFSPDHNVIHKRMKQGVEEIEVQSEENITKTLQESTEKDGQEDSDSISNEKKLSFVENVSYSKVPDLNTEENVDNILSENIFAENCEQIVEENMGDILERAIKEITDPYVEKEFEIEDSISIPDVIMKSIEANEAETNFSETFLPEVESMRIEEESFEVPNENIVTENTNESVKEILRTEEDVHCDFEENQNVMNEEHIITVTEVTETMSLLGDNLDEPEKHKSDKSNGDGSSTLASNLFDPSEMESTPNMRAALKTFIKPFTAAKKSLGCDKTNSSSGKKTALKTFANKQLNRRLYNANPNDIIKDGSAIFILKKTNSNGSSCEEISDDDTKDGNLSLQELIHSNSFCICARDGVPCLFNGEPLQQICEGEDTINGKIVACSREVSEQCLLTPSKKVKYRTFCDIHLWRLKHHHCCPKCGIFCTEGDFLMCQIEHLDKNNDVIHLFHPKCYLIPNAGLPPGCPHCCRFTVFNSVKLQLKESPEELNDSQNKSDAVRNLTSHFNSYNLIMTTVESEKENNDAETLLTIPEKQELESMLMAINSDKCLHLRPTGKCLYNPIKIGDVRKVLQLLVNGVNPNHKFKTHKNNTPLHIAAYFGFTGIVHILLQYGGLKDAVNDDLETPLILAVERKHLAVVRYLMYAGVQLDVKTENGLTSFHTACKNGSKEIAQFLYKIGNFDINIQDDGGWTPLVWACEYKHLDVVLWLLELGGDPNIRDSEENVALHWAACSGEDEILDILLDNGCSLNLVNKRGDTAMHIAARKDHYSCVRLLLGRGALLDRKNEDGETPIMCCDEDTKSYRFLKKYQSFVSKKFKRTPSEHIVFRDISFGLEKYAIQAVNEVDNEEFTLNFRYVIKSCQTSNIKITTTVDSMQWCYCINGCGTCDCTCTNVSKCWYDVNGCLSENFDMLDPPVIYECHKLCHCPKTCINRVVQKGLRIPLQLFRTVNQGWGVRCLKDLIKGAFVCEYLGELIHGSEVPLREDDSYIFDLSSKDDDYCLDGRFYGNVARFINHSCEPNLIALPVFIQHHDQNFPHIAFFTSRDIPAFEELCFDYGKEFWIAKSQTTLCTCGTQSCKYSKDTIDDTLYEALKSNNANQGQHETVALKDADIIYSLLRPDVNKIETFNPLTNYTLSDYQMLESSEIISASTTEPEVLSVHIVDNDFEMQSVPDSKEIDADISNSFT